MNCVVITKGGTRCSNKAVIGNKCMLHYNTLTATDEEKEERKKRKQERYKNVLYKLWR